VQDGEYVYRHPGLATQGLLNRAVEAEVEGIARDLGLDDTFIYEDTAKGWKISKFIHLTEAFDYHNEAHVKKALSMIRSLHQSGRQVESVFNLPEETKKIKELLIGKKQLDFPDYETLDSRILSLYQQVSENAELCLCHNDFYDPNILICKDQFSLIDWEYAGMSDYASDLGTFVCCSNYNYEEALGVFESYFERELTHEETIHCLAYVALASYHWFIWSINKEVSGEPPVGEWLHHWYSYARDFSLKAEQLIIESTER
jgi:thiamine kinase-like enzyme